MPDVKYIDNNGFAWLKRVKDGAKPEQYYRGIFIGPPDLRELNLPEEDLKILQEALVDAWLVNAELLRGSANRLRAVVKHALPQQDTRALVRGIKSVMQREVYKEK
jgi:hypothetical protein